MLDIFADRARLGILVGHRIIWLVQSNDPRLSFDPVGRTPTIRTKRPEAHLVGPSTIAKIKRS